MPSVNPGPSSSQTLNTVDVLTPVNANGGPVTQGANALRLIAVYQNMPLSGLGDIQLPVLNASKWAPVSVAFTNGLVNGVSASVAAATLSINSGPAVSGTSLRASGVLTGQTASTVFTTAAAATTNVALTSQTVYVNVTVAVAGGTVDVYLYGYDISTPNA